jgi:phosphoribosylcarboxyaminoimidazole (NCAIR) mutase
VPPLNEEVVVSIALCPESIVVGATEITGAAENAELTRTVTTFEVTVCGVPELSVTSSSNDHVPATVSVPVDIVGRLLVVQLKDTLRSE